MKKLIATTALVVSMAVTCSACSLFSNDAVVKFGDLYTFNEPKDLKYDERIVLMGEGYESTIEDYLNAAAYPDTMMYDDDGNIVGVYDYDAETGMAYGWNDFSDGSYNAFEEGEEVDYENLHLKVEEMDKNRIGKIRIQIHHPEESEDGEKEKDGEHE